MTVILENDNIPYTLILWPEDWDKYKNNIDIYKGQAILFEGEWKKNTISNQFQFQLVEDSTIICLGETEETKVEPIANITVKKGDRVRTDKGDEGVVIKYPSNYEISIQLDDNTIKKIEKWDITDVL